MAHPPWTAPLAPRARNLSIRLCLWLFCPTSLVFSLASLGLTRPFATPSQAHKAPQNNSQQNVSTRKCLGCRLLLFQLSGFLTILIFSEPFDSAVLFNSQNKIKASDTLESASFISPHYSFFFQSLKKGGLDHPAPAIAWRRVVCQSASGTSKMGRAFPFLFLISFHE